MFLECWMMRLTLSSSSCWGEQFFTTIGSPLSKTNRRARLCSVVRVCLGIVSAGGCVREMLLAAPRGTCRTLRRGGMGLIDVDRPEI